jgi:hypothetical protein
LDAADSAPVPNALRARTRNVYDVPLVSPVTVRLLTFAPALTVRTGSVAVPSYTSTSWPRVGKPV